MLSWFLVSADTKSVIEKFCADRCPKSFPWITEAFHNKKKTSHTYFGPGSSHDCQ
jgi:hypothetical protein